MSVPNDTYLSRLVGQAAYDQGNSDGYPSFADVIRSSSVSEGSAEAPVTVKEAFTVLMERLGNILHVNPTDPALNEYLESFSVVECICLTVPHLVGIIRTRHERFSGLPSLNELQDNSSGLALALLRIACTSPRSVSSRWTGNDSRLYQKAKDFWRNLFVIGTLFQRDDVTSWDDIRPVCTFNCMISFDGCVSLIHTLRNSTLLSTGRTATSFLVELVTDAMRQSAQTVHGGSAQGPDFRSVALGVNATPPTAGIAVTIPGTSITPEVYSNAFRAFKAEMLSRRNIMRQFPNDEALRTSCSNFIRCLCNTLLNMCNQEVNQTNFDMMMWEVFGDDYGHPGDM